MVETQFCHKLTTLVASCLWDVAGVVSHDDLVNRCARRELSGGDTQKQRDGIAGTEVGWPPEWQWFWCAACQSLGWSATRVAVGHQSGNGLRAVFWYRLWTTLVRATSPITLHR